MGNTILINPYRFPPPFTAPGIGWNGNDVGITNGESFTNGASLTMPVNSISEGDQILVAVAYNFSSSPTDNDPRCSDDVDGTIGWGNTFLNGSTTSDMWVDFHFKTATGGETDITYTTPATVDLVGYVIRFDPEDHIEFTSRSDISAGSNNTTYSNIESVDAIVDTSLGWFIGVQRGDAESPSLSSPGQYTLGTNEAAGNNQNAGIAIYEQFMDEGDSTLQTNITFTDSEPGHGQQITQARKRIWSTPVIEGHQFSSGSISSSGAFSPSNPAGMQVGDLLLYQSIVSDDSSTTLIWNGDTDTYWNRFVNIASSAGQDWRSEWGWRWWTGTEPTWSALTSNINSRSIEVIMYRVTGANPTKPIESEFGSSYGNTAPTTFTIPLMNCPPNALAVIGLATWGAVGTTTQDPGDVGLFEYASPTTRTRFWTGANENQDPLPYGILDWDSSSPEKGRFGFYINGEGTLPAYTEWPLVENYTVIDQEFSDWENGETWNNFWGWGWKPDGTKFVTVNNTNDRIYGFDFSTAFDFDTTSNNSANPGQTVSVVGLDVMFNEDGTKYSTWSWFSTNTMRTYNAGTAYEPATSDTLIGQADFGSYSNSDSESYWIDRKGVNLYILTAGNSPNQVLHFKMSTPWDVSTAVKLPDEFDLPGGRAGGRLYMSPSGRDLLFSEGNNDDGVRHYRMGLAHNLDTMGEISQLVHNGQRGGGIWMTDDATRLIIGPGANDPYDVQVRRVADTSLDEFVESVILLADFEGTDAATSFDDQSIDRTTITFAGNAQLDTDQARYGSSSVLFDGTGDYLQMADETKWDIASNDFTLEVDIRLNSVAGNNKTIFDKRNDGAQFGWGASVDVEGTGKFAFFGWASGGATPVISMESTTTLAVDTWYTLAVTRSGTSWNLYVDGTREDTGTETAAIGPNTSPFRIGQSSNTTNSGRPFDGWMDNVRITNGVARYTGASYTLPGGPYPLP